MLVLLGQVLELRARERTGDAIRALLDLAPKTARRIAPDGEDETVPLDRIASAIGCGCVPAKVCRSTASFSTGSERRRRVDGDRRVDSGTKSSGRSSHRRHTQRYRQRW